MLSVRFLVAFLAFLLTAIQYMQRINMSVAIVCMINNTRLAEISRESKNRTISRLSSTNDLSFNSSALLMHDHGHHNQKCAFQKSTNATSKLDGPFVWDKSIQGLILSSFFYGYLFTQIIGAWLSIKVNALSSLLKI